MRRSGHRFVIHALLLVTATVVAAQRTPQSAQSAERIDWRARIEAIDELLARQKWRAGRKQTVRTTEQARAEAWSGPELAAVMAELALRRAIIEINLGHPNDALWHWYTALNLDREIAARDLTSYGLAKTLSDVELREATEVPPRFDRLSDLERLQMDPPVVPAVEPPSLVTNTAAAAQLQPDVLVEVIVDKTGRLLQPVLLTRNAHPVLVSAAFEWLAGMPPLQPARVDGRPVDSLEHINVSFLIDRSGGQIFLPPIETMRPEGPPDNR